MAPPHKLLNLLLLIVGLQGGIAQWNVGESVSSSRSSGSSGSGSDGFFRDGRDGDLQSIWSFGVNGFFVPPPDFAGVPITPGTIIPTSAVGLLCFDGFGGCSVEISAIIGGNLGLQVFNVSTNTVRFLSSLCRARINRLGRVVLQARLAEVSTRLLPAVTLNIPILAILQLASPNFAFIEFDQLFVLQGQAIRIQKLVNFLRDGSGRSGSGGGYSVASAASSSNANRGKDGPGAPVGGPPGGPVGAPGAGSGGSKHDNDFDSDGGSGSGSRGSSSRLGDGLCPNLVDDTAFVGLGLAAFGGFGGVSFPSTSTMMGTDDFFGFF